MEFVEGRELEGMRALLAVPSYGPVDPLCQKDIRVAMMVASNHGLIWDGDSSPDRLGWAEARNAAAQSLVRTPSADGMMWIDSDMRIKPTDITSLLTSVRQYDAEFVTGVYHQRGGYHNPVFYHYNKERNKFQPFEQYPENVFAPIEGCGFGFVWTSRNLIEKIARHPDFDPKFGWFPDNRDSGGFGEDMSFCYKAMQVGVQLYVNTAVQLGHTGDPHVVYREDYLAKRNQYSLEDRKRDNEKGKERWGFVDEEAD